MFKFLKSLLPEVYTFATPEQEIANLDAESSQVKEQANLLNSVITLCHHTSTVAMSVKLLLDNPKFATMIENNPEGTDVQSSVKRIFKREDMAKSVDELNLKILTVIFEHYPELKLLNSRLTEIK
jgi:hypothetical protein